MLGIGMASVPPCAPWGINFGGGLNSTAVILACIERGHRPDWILFADTGSEYPGTLEHVERMRRLVASPLLAMRKLTGEIPWTRSY